ncbi:MAG: glutamate racemase [Candidatus Omnitrophica bacterium]|nr:glutamate racemase [Candidatus Omnitrophota bacterium]
MTSKRVSRHSKGHRPIGVFDSGLGGLTVVREIRRRLPHETIVYYGDVARLPYGTKSPEQILRFSIQNTLFLLKHKVKALVIACNSSTSAAANFLRRHFNVPIVDVVQPAAEVACRSTRSGRIGVIATSATIGSRVYEKALKKRNPKVKVFGEACPLFVPLVEEGWLEGKITHDVLDAYLRKLKKKKIDVLILGCTHYPLLKKSIQKVMGSRVRLVDSMAPTVQQLAQLFDRRDLHAAKKQKGLLKIYVSDKPGNFVKVGESFLGEKMNFVEVVRQK